MRFEYELPVSGPNAEGTAFIVVDGQLFSEEKWDVKSTTVVVDGEEIPIEGDGHESRGLEVNIEEE